MNFPPQTVERYLPLDQLDQLASWALFGAGCGLLAELSFLPELVKALLLLTFVLVGPGSVVLDWMGTLPLVAVRALVPVTGLSLVLLGVSGALLLGFWSSRVTLLILVVLTAAGGLVNRRRAAASPRADSTRAGTSPVRTSAETPGATAVKATAE